MNRGVHIATTGFVPRDAISQHVIEEQRAIREMGLRCEIFAEPSMTDPRYRSMARSIREWARATEQDDAVILHYSIADPRFEWLLRRARRCGLTYHNITPPEYLWQHAPRLALECLRGRQHLGSYADRVSVTAADSRFNAQELRALGFPEPIVVGVLRPRLAAGTRVPRPREHAVRMLFVGRGVPNKAQHDVILAVAAVRATGLDAHLQLVGSWDGLEGYLQSCQHLVRDLQLDEYVTFSGSVSDDDLAGAYASSDVFVCLSDHEGFCAPLVEAMQAGLPIVAHDAGAVGETVGAAALLLRDKTPSIVAEAIFEVLNNNALRERMRVARNERLTFHGADAVNARLSKYIDALLRPAAAERASLDR